MQDRCTYARRPGNGGNPVTNQTAKRVLIVEDEYLVALHLEDLLTEIGHEIVGPASRIDEAMELAWEGDIDFAVLDVNLAGTQSFPVADILRERGIPFVFATGYGTDGLIDGYRHETVLSKPYEAGELADAIAAGGFRRSPVDPAVLAGPALV